MARPINPNRNPARWLKAMIVSPPAGSMCVTITPIIAQAMLEYNTGNRPISKKKVAQYADDMKNNAWLLTGEPIVFSKDGILNNGQQRLLACIEANTSFPTDVRFGVPREAFQLTDTGKKRSGADVLATLGETNVVTLTAALALVKRWEDGTLRQIGGRSSLYVDNRTIVKVLEAHPQIRESINVGRLAYHEFHGFPPSVLVFCHWLFSQRNEKMADEFIMASGTGLNINTRNHPIFRLRHRMAEYRNGRSRPDLREMIAVTIKAWNAWRNHEEMSILYFRTTGKHGETMPEPI